MLSARGRVALALRSTLAERGYLQVDTPIVERDDKPDDRRSLRTSSDSFGPLRLRLVAEPYLKLLLASGIDRVYDLARSFRDEPADATHNLEYTLLEIYAAEATWSDMQDLAYDLITAAASSVNGSTTIEGPPGERIDLASLWPQRSIHDAVGEAIAHDISVETSADVLRRMAGEHGVPLPEPQTADRLTLRLYEDLVEPNTVGPVLYTGFPSSLAPQARPQDEDPRLAEQWDLVILGCEIATGATEITDQEEQSRRIGSRPIHPALATALSTGLPPCAGLAIGFDRLVMATVGATALQDVIPFSISGTAQTHGLSSGEGSAG